MLLYSRDEWFWIIMMSLASVQIYVSLDFEGILQFWTARIKFLIKMALAEYIYYGWTFRDI